MDKIASSSDSDYDTEGEDISDTETTTPNQLDDEESLRRTIALLRECATQILLKNVMHTAITRKFLGRSESILLWDKYVDSRDYCGRELSTYFNAPLNTLQLDLGDITVNDITKSLLWNVAALNGIDGMNLVFTTSNVTTNGRKCYYYEITVVDKYDISCIIF